MNYRSVAICFFFVSTFLADEQAIVDGVVTYASEAVLTLGKGQVERPESIGSDLIWLYLSVSCGNQVICVVCPHAVLVSAS